MGNKKWIFFIILMVLLGAIAIFYSCFNSEAELSGKDTKRPLKEYRIIGNSGIFRIEVRESESDWRLLAEGLKSRKACEEIIDQNFAKGKQ